MIDIDYLDVIAVSERVLQRQDTLLSSDLLHSALSSHHYYNTNMLKAASVYRGLIKNHAFQDGNKRTATIVLTALLRTASLVPINNIQAVKLALDVAINNYSVEQVAELIQKATKRH